MLEMRSVSPWNKLTESGDGKRLLPRNSQLSRELKEEKCDQVKALEDGRRTREVGCMSKEHRTRLHEFKELNEGQWCAIKTNLELPHFLWPPGKMEALAFYHSAVKWDSTCEIT